jgi:hypothetical protein
MSVLLRRLLLALLLLQVSGQVSAANDSLAPPSIDEVRQALERLLTASDGGNRRAYDQFEGVYRLIYEQAILEANSRQAKTATTMIPALDRWVLEKARGGSATAQHWMGARSKVLQAYGAKPPDLAEVARWYRLSAEQGFGPAQDALGQILGFFPEFAREPFEAEKWLFQAVREGEPAADQRLLLAIRLDSERAGYRPDADILAWLRELADSGDAEARSLVDKLVMQD